MGYPAGISPEIIVKCLSKPEVYKSYNPFVIGDSKIMNDAIKIAGTGMRLNIFSDVQEAEFSFGKIDLLDLNNIDMNEFEYGVIRESFGRASLEYVAKAFQLASQNLVDGIVIASMHKEAYHKANPNYCDDADYLKEFSKSPRVIYVKHVSANGHKVIITSVTGHMPMRNVLDNIKMEKVFSKIRMAHKVSKQVLGIKSPRIAVSAINPHGGEGGLYGCEEIEEISPAVEKARESGINVSGPYPGSWIFRSVFRGEFDAVVGMYHDQVNLAKNLASRTSTLMYLGLFVPCVTVDHGTAFDIAGKGIADSRYIEDALEVVTKISSVSI